MDQSSPIPRPNDAGPSGSLAESAKGWHSIQLAVLGLLGFSGVMRVGEAWTGPEWTAWVALVMMVLAFLLAVLAIFMVGKIAYPFYGGAARQPDSQASAQLRLGIRLTFVAVALVAVAGLAAWWPGDLEPAGWIVPGSFR